MGFKDVDDEKLPWFYRLILRLPKPVLEHFSPEWIHGIYWAIIVPLFIIFEFFLSLYLLLTFPFPINLIATLIVPTTIFIAFLRIQLERLMNSWNAMIKKESTEWDVDNAIQEYLKVLKKKESVNRENRDEHSEK
jgi:hypothetical protein